MICSKFDYSNSPSMHIKWVHIIHTNTHRYVIRLFIYSYLINNHELWGLTFIACRQYKTFVIFIKQYTGKSNDERRHFLFWIFRLKTILRQVMKLGYCYFIVSNFTFVKMTFITTQIFCTLAILLFVKIDANILSEVWMKDKIDLLHKQFGTEFRNAEWYQHYLQQQKAWRKDIFQFPVMTVVRLLNIIY